MERYILVEWPESQEWMEHSDCYLAAENDEVREFFAPTYFVPEKEYCKKKGYPYPFSNTCTNGELIDLLSQFPRDAIVGIEYCSPKKLQYFKDRNFIAID